MAVKSVVLSDEKVNRYGFRVLTSGINLEAFKANPVMLREHNYDCIIGRWENIRVENGQLLADPVFDESCEEGKKAKLQFEGGFLRAASLGFMVIAESADASVIVEGQTRPTVTQSEATEASFVAVPANSGCLALYGRNGERLKLDEATLATLNLLQPITSTKPDNMKNVTLSLAALTALGLTENFTQADFETKFQALKLKADSYDALKKETDDAKKLSAKAMVDKAIAEKRLKETDREAFEKLAFDNPAAAQTAIERIPGVTLPNDRIKEDGNGKQEQLSAGRDKWTFQDWNKNDYPGLEKLRLENKAEYDRLFDNYKKDLAGKK